MSTSMFKSKVPRSLVKGAANLGAMVARNQIARDQRLQKARSANPQSSAGPRKKKREKSQNQLTTRGGQSMVSGIVQAPSVIGVTSQASRGISHTPFVVSGHNILGSINMNASTGETYFSNAADTNTNTNRFSLDPMGNGTVAADFRSLQTVVRNVARSFTRYRWKKLLFSYVPVVPTNTIGTVVIGFSPEVVITSSAQNQPLEIMAFERNFTTPVWSPLTFNGLGWDGIEPDWCYADPSGSSGGEANLRQESAGSVFMGVLGTFATAPTQMKFGYLSVEFELELEGLSNTDLFSVIEPKKKDGEVIEPIRQQSVAASHTQCGASSTSFTPTNETEFVSVGGLRRYIPQY